MDDYYLIYAILPSCIYKTKELSAEDKLIAERIVFLCKKTGYSWITNKKLAEMYGIREDSVSQHIRNLKRYGFIKCVYGKDINNKSHRNIYLTKDLWGIKPSNNRVDNREQLGSPPGYNNKYKNKTNNTEPVPSWLYNYNDIKAEPITDPEDLKFIEDLKKEFGDHNE